MKATLNIIIGIFVIILASDIENNANSNVLNYSNSLICIGALTAVGFLRVYYNEFTEFLKRPKLS